MQHTNFQCVCYGISQIDRAWQPVARTSAANAKSITEAAQHHAGGGSSSLQKDAKDTALRKKTHPWTPELEEQLSIPAKPMVQVRAMACLYCFLHCY